MGLLDTISNGMVNPDYSTQLGLLSGLFQAGAPSRIPVSNGQAFGMAVQGANTGLKQGYETQQMRLNNLMLQQKMKMFQDFANQNQDLSQQPQQGQGYDPTAAPQINPVTQPGSITNGIIGGTNYNAPSLQPQQPQTGMAGLMSDPSYMKLSRRIQQANLLGIPDDADKVTLQAIANNYGIPESVKTMRALGQDLPQMGHLATQKAINEAQDISGADKLRIANDQARMRYEGIPVTNPIGTGIVTKTGKPQISSSLNITNGIKYQGQDLSALSPKNAQELIAKRTAELPKDLTSMEDMVAKTDATTDQAKAILNHPGLNMATGITSVVGKIPGTDAYNAARLVDTLKNEVMLSQLQAFRAASANGSSGFGQLSNAEGETLRNAITNLDRAQTTDQFKQALENVIQTNAGIKERMKNGYQRLYGEQPNIKEYHTNPLSGNYAPITNQTPITHPQFPGFSIAR